MSKNKKIPVAIAEKLNGLDHKSKVLFFELWLKSDCAGIVQNIYGPALDPLFELGLAQCTVDHIVLIEYLSSNYGKELKETYNPHKPVLAAILNAGLSYSAEHNKIIIPEDAIITDFSSLEKLTGVTHDTETGKPKKVPVVAKKSIVDRLSSIQFALSLAALLTIAQSFHTGYSLYLISDLPNPYNMIFAIGAAVLLDALIIFFVATGSIKNSLVFLCFSTMMNVYAFHHSPQIDYMEYNSFFALMIAFIIPYSIHAVASRINAVHIG